MRKIGTVCVSLFVVMALIASCTARSASSKNLNDSVAFIEEQTPSTTESIISTSDSGDGTYHVDTSYKYQYRTGTSGSYIYNYDVEGTDPEGNDVSGNIDIGNDGGHGTITNSDGDEIEIDVEWIGYGEIKGTDSEGNTYDLHGAN